MGSLRECRIEGFICRLCSAINSNVIHIYSEEGEELSLKNESFFFGGISSLCWVELGENLFNNIFSIGFLGLMKKLEQKINVYLKIDVSSRSIELPMALKMCEILLNLFFTFSCIDMIHCRKWYVFRAIPNWSSIIVSFSVWFRIRKWKRVPWWDRGGSLWVVELIWNNVKMFNIHIHPCSPY